MTFEQAFAMFTETVFPHDGPAKAGSCTMVESLRLLARPAALCRHQTADLPEGDDSFVFLARGATKLVAFGSSGSSQILTFQLPGDFVCVPANAPHTYQLVAIRPAEVLAFAKDEMMALAGKHPAIMELLAGRALLALQQCRQQLVTVGRRSATERVAGFLMALAQRHQACGRDNRSLSLAMTRNEIADSLGLTVETVSRQFSLLRDRKLIETPARGMVLVPDWSRLARCAGHFPQGG